MAKTKYLMVFGIMSLVHIYYSWSLVTTLCVCVHVATETMIIEREREKVDTEKTDTDRYNGRESRHREDRHRQIQWQGTGLTK